MKALMMYFFLLISFFVCSLTSPQTHALLISRWNTSLCSWNYLPLSAFRYSTLNLHIESTLAYLLSVLQWYMSLCGKSELCYVQIHDFFLSIYVQVTLNDDCRGLLPLGPCLLLTTWMRESHRRPQTMVRHVCVCFMCPPPQADAC